MKVPCCLILGRHEGGIVAASGLVRSNKDDEKPSNPGLSFVTNVNRIQQALRADRILVQFQH
jgi:hypothetical protein